MPDFESLPSQIEEEISQWQRMHGLHVLANEKAKSALNRLFWDGCDPVVVLRFIKEYCGIGLNVSVAKRVNKQWIKRLLKLAKRLNEDAQEVRTIDKHLKLDLDFSEEMENCAHYLEKLYVPEVNSTILSRGSFLQSGLACAAYYISFATDTGPHYRELADLVSLFTTRCPDEDSLRHKVERFRQRSDYVYLDDDDLKSMAERDHKKWDALRHNANKIQHRAMQKRVVPCRASPGVQSRSGAAK